MRFILLCICLSIILTGCQTAKTLIVSKPTKDIQTNSTKQIMEAKALHREGVLKTVTSHSTKESNENIADAKKQDTLLPRAMGESKYGNLLVVPKYSELIEKLGVPSCYGLESDYRIKSDYDILFKTDAKTTKIDSIDNLTIINPKNTTFRIKKIILGDKAFFYFIPRYKDCHGIQFYFFGVEKGAAYPIKFQEDGQLFKNFDMLPKTEPAIVNGMVVIKGSYAPGVNPRQKLYFIYDSRKHLMILKKTVATEKS